MSLPKIIAIVGPTASGKTSLSIELARKFNGEVISADSRQVYKGLNIGTGKVTKKEMQRVPHHLLDVASPRKAFTAAQYVSKAKRACADILKRGKVPIICGGTGFYIDALVGRIPLPEVPPNPILRKRLEKMSASEMFEELTTKDPNRATTIDRHNPRRLVRALEIAEAMGSSPQLPPEPVYDVLWIGLTWPQDKLDARIQTRLTERLEGGMQREGIKLHKEGLSYKRMIELGLEYRAMARHMQGVTTKNEMEEELFRDIRRYSRKQMMYWKRNSDIRWMDGKNTKGTDKIVKSFLKTN